MIVLRSLEHIVRHTVLVLVKLKDIAKILLRGFNYNVKRITLIPNLCVTDFNKKFDILHLS